MVQRQKGEHIMSCLIRYNPAGSILLPSGYIRLSYIQLTGSQWIDSGTLSTDVDEVYYEVSPDSIPISEYMHIIAGTRSASSNNYKIYGVVQANGKLKMHYGSTSWDSTTKMVVGGRYIIKGILKESQQKLWINGNLEIDKAITGGPMAGVKNTIGAWNGNGNISAQFKGKIYFARFWKDGQIVRDFVPVQKSDGTIGLLDLVNNTFYGNSGTGTFIAGPECPQGFPTSEYCQVEWLGNQKATGYVAIPYTHKADTWVDTEMSFDSFYAWNTMFGACTADNGSDSFTFGCSIKGRINCDLGAAYSAAFGMTAGTFYRFLVSSKTIIKDTTTYSPNKTTTACDKTWALFTRHNNTSYTNEAGHGKFKYMKIYEGTFNSVSDSTLKAHLIPCYRRSDMKPGFYDLVGRSFHEFVGIGASLGPSITFGYGEVVNNVGAEAYPMLGTQYTETNKFTHTGNNKDDFRGLPVYQRVEPGQQISISFDTDVTQWASHHDNSGGTTNKGKWSMFIYFNKAYNPKGGNFDSFACYAASQIKSLGGTRWKYSFTVPANMHMIRLCTNLYSDGSTSYTAHFWNFNWSFGDTGCQVNPLHAIPHNISTGNGRNGEKNGAFHFDGTSYMEVDVGSILPADCTKYTIMMWAKVDTSEACALFSQRNQTSDVGRCVLYDNTNMYYDDGVRNHFSHGVTRNNWNHYAFVRNGSNKYVYINRQLVNTSSASTAEVFSSVLTIGACQIIDSGVVNQFVGDMKDIKIFDTNLDASGIQQEM